MRDFNSYDMTLKLCVLLLYFFMILKAEELTFKVSLRLFKGLWSFLDSYKY